MSRTPVTRVGLQLADYAFDGIPDTKLFDRLAEIALAAEGAGFDSLWTMDHLHQIATVGDREQPILEAYTTLAALAAVTKSARLGTLVTACGFRSPALLAKMVTTIDIISGGRTILGIGAGWHEEEYRSYGMKFPGAGERLAQLSEAVQICRAMFTEQAPAFSGAHHSIHEPLNVPEPIQPDGPPILIGGGGERTLIPMVARYGDACNFFGAPATVRRKIDLLERACAEISRDPSEITKTWLGGAIMEKTEWDLQSATERLGRRLGLPPRAARGFALCGTRDDFLNQAAEYRAVGVDGIIVYTLDPDDVDYTRRIGEALSATA